MGKLVCICKAQTIFISAILYQANIYEHSIRHNVYESVLLLLPIVYGNMSAVEYHLPESSHILPQTMIFNRYTVMIFDNLLNWNSGRVAKDIFAVIEFLKFFCSKQFQVIIRVMGCLFKHSVHSSMFSFVLKHFDELLPFLVGSINVFGCAKSSQYDAIIVEKTCKIFRKCIFCVS